jgi:hypothetical protein
MAYHHRPWRKVHILAHRLEVCFAPHLGSSSWRRQNTEADVYCLLPSMVGIGFSQSGAMSNQTIDVNSANAALDNNYILVLTTNRIEKLAVDSILKETCRATIGVSHDGCTIGKIGDRFILHVTGQGGAQIDKSVSRLARLFVNTALMPKPQLIILAGFAWRNPKLVGPKDVVLSGEVWCINHLRHEGAKTNRRLVQRESTVPDLASIAQLMTQQIETAHVYVGPIASCETYFNNLSARDKILDQFPDVLAGEMEAFDLVADMKVPWVILKGISDDAGDSIDRADQPAAADRSACLIPCLLEALGRDGFLLPHRADRATNFLSDSLIGQAIRITATKDGQIGLNDHLNDSVGPQVMRKLARYASDGDRNGKLQDTMCDMLLEITQNAIRHGNASHVTIDFTETAVTVNDDGRLFDIASLAGTNGGSRAWHRFRTYYLADDRVNYLYSPRSEGGNTYRFKIAYLSEELRRAREHCTAVVQRGLIGEARSYKSKLVFNPKCNTLYFDATLLLMSSRTKELSLEARLLLKEGKGLYIACRNWEQVMQFEQELVEFTGPMLRIFVGDRQ